MEEEQNKNPQIKASVLHLQSHDLAAVSSRVCSIVCCYQCRLHNLQELQQAEKEYRDWRGRFQWVVVQTHCITLQNKGTSVSTGDVFKWEATKKRLEKFKNWAWEFMGFSVTSGKIKVGEGGQCKSKMYTLKTQKQI